MRSFKPTNDCFVRKTVICRLNNRLIELVVYAVVLVYGLIEDRTVAAYTSHDCCWSKIDQTFQISVVIVRANTNLGPCLKCKGMFIHSKLHAKRVILTYILSE